MSMISSTATSFGIINPAQFCGLMASQRPRGAVIDGFKLHTKNAAENELKFQRLPPRRTFSKSGTSDWKVQIIKGKFAVLVGDWPLVVALVLVFRIPLVHDFDSAVYPNFAMAGFLRKKNTKSQQQAQAQAQATHHQQRQHFQPEPAAAPPQSLPPLYARFATSSKSSSANAGTSTPPKIVSGPMALGSNAGRGLQARNDVNEPRKSAPRESWYKPAPPPDPLPPPRLQVQRTSSPKRHASPNHRSPTHAKPNDHHVPSPMIPDEKPLPIPVLPSTTRQAYNNVPPPASSRRESVMTSPSRPYSRLPAGSGTVPQDPQSQPPYANTLLNSSNHDLPSTRRSILRNANPPPAREELATRLEGNRTEEIRHSPSATPPNQFRTALPPNAFHNVSSRAPVAVVSHPSTVPLSHRTSMQAELVHPSSNEYNTASSSTQHLPSPTNSPPSPPPPSELMAIGKIKSMLRGDRILAQGIPRSPTEDDARITSSMPKSFAAEVIPRAKKPVPINGSSHSVLQKNAAPQGRSGMTRGSSPSLQQPQQQAPYQPRSSYIPSSPQSRSFSPPLSPKLDAQPTMQGKPLIFSAMHAVHDVPQGNRIADGMGLGRASPPKMAPNAAFAYPSPPMEFSPSPLDRPHPLPSQNLLANLRTESPLVRPQPLYETQTPPPTPPKEHQPPQRALGMSPQVTDHQLLTGKVLNRRDSPDRQINHHEASPSASRSGSPLNHRTSLHIRKLSKSSLATRSQVNSQASSNGSSVNVASGAKGGSHPGHTRSRSGTVSSRLIPPTDPNRESETDSMLLDDDPFARVEGVKLLPVANESTTKHRRTPSTPDSVSSLAREKRTRTTSKPSSVESVAQDENPLGKPESSPVKPEDYREARTMRRGEGLEKPPAFMADMPIRKDRTPIPFPLEVFLADPTLLSGLLAYLTFSEWCRLSTMNKQIHALLIEAPGLKEIILERYLSTVGYARWIYDGADPLPLSIRDLNDYMRGVSTPTHEYSRVAGLYVQCRANRGIPGYDAIQETARSLSACTRAYSRVVLRLRAQAEAQYVLQSAQQPRAPPPAIFNYNGVGSSGRSMSSRAPSPSSMSHSHAHSSVMGHQTTHASPSGTSTFRSPLYRLRRAPLLRVFVPSQEEWLSDAGVVDCENELRRAGVVDLMRLGDVVWDVAVGDEGNVGRLVWDGSYLLDLDYAYSSVGDLPKYIRSLAFPPSYFHRVIRTGSSSSNPIAHIDISPWGEEIAANLQLLQDRVRTETPQGAYHNVVRWVHRSSFTIRPARGRTPNSRPSSRPSSRAGSRPAPNSIMQIGNSSRVHIPDTDGLCVDPGWYGTVIVETEGTNEALADLQDRCGPGAFPPRATPTHERFAPTKDKEAKRIFRILRERSRPGEIWIRAVSAKERLL